MWYNVRTSAQRIQITQSNVQEDFVDFILVLHGVMSYNQTKKGVAMLNKVLIMCSVLLIAGCDNVNITRYPEPVQKCYNSIIYDADNCTTSKKTIVRYCECQYAQTEKLEAKWAELNEELEAHHAFSEVFIGGGWGNLAVSALRDSVQHRFEKYAQELFDECAAKTGYTRVKNCKKPEVESE